MVSNTLMFVFLWAGQRVEPAKAQVASHEPTIVQIITSLCGGLHCGGIVSAVATTLPL